jgi:hypothetical protein
MATDDCFVVVFDSTGAGDDEVGEGMGLTGADATLTCVGNVPGASGGYRQLDRASNQWFTGNGGIIPETLFASTSWTIVCKFADMTTTGAQHSYHLSMADNWASSTERVSFVMSSGSVFSVTCEEDNTLETETFATNCVNSTGYFAGWANGTTMYAGVKLSATRPLKSADFDEIETFSSLTGDWTSESFLDTYIGSWGDGSSTNDATIKFAWFVFIKLCLF